MWNFPSRHVCGRFIPQGLLWATLALMAGGSLSAAPQDPVCADFSSKSGDIQRSIFHYRMKGKVRLLFFWIGKDNVGGGTIGFSKGPVGPDHGWAEQVEVLFGSIPERVPGKINRWGFGKECSQWQEDPSQGRPRQLSYSVFEGFMRHSNEESISEVRSRARADQAGKLFWYDAIRSSVAPLKAVSEQRVFSETTDFDFRQPELVQNSYQQQAAHREPDKRKELENQSDLYAQPYGFLTAVRDTLRNIAENFERDPSNWKRMRPRYPYVFKARLYQLRVKGINYHRKFALTPEKKDKKKGLEFLSVMEVKFQLKNLETGDTHDFKIWSPLGGPLQGMPLKIEDRPRWWLRVELYLELDKMPESAAEAPDSHSG